ncbi:MAG: metalloregulator ArsR/SmtB family transcription factor [Planctomycetota bacterium]
MVSASDRLDLVFQALSNPARRSIVERLRAGECNLTELAAPLRMTFPAASKHVRVLERARLVKRRVSGREHLCRLEAKPLEEANAFLEAFRERWEGTFQALEGVLEQMKADPKRRKR